MLVCVSRQLCYTHCRYCVLSKPVTQLVSLGQRNKTEIGLLSSLLRPLLLRLPLRAPLLRVWLLAPAMKILVLLRPCQMVTLNGSMNGTRA